MLNHLHIRHFAIIDDTELELSDGMTALTGETGAGKSILLDALGLVLGDRASAASVQQGATRADITATFQTDELPAARAWLAEHELDESNGDDDSEAQGVDAGIATEAEIDSVCVLRRTISTNGKSRATINGIPVTAAMMKAFGALLVSIHGQHAHHTLGKSAEQRRLLDDFGGDQQLSRVAASHENWQRLNRQVNESQTDAGRRQERIDLLRFQLQEFDELDIGNQGASDIELEHRFLANATRIMELGATATDALEAIAAPSLDEATRSLSELVEFDQRLREALDLVESAAIQSSEAASQLRATMSALEHDEARLRWLDEKLGALHRLSRKHQCELGQLTGVEQQLRDELDTYAAPADSVDALKSERDALRVVYDTEASKLSRHRKKFAKRLSKEITASMQTLGMTGGVFDVAVATDASAEPSPHGQDTIQFLVSPNPGVDVAPLSRVASGGELSRISLCIQLATIKTRSVPTLLFDEVDAGIGGSVASTVGKLLRQVGAGAQVLCVTHLPQVAAQAHHHLRVQKSVSQGRTHTEVAALEGKAVRDEIARMLGSGDKLTARSRKHAEELLEAADG